MHARGMVWEYLDHRSGGAAAVAVGLPDKSVWTHLKYCTDSLYASDGAGHCVMVQLS